MLCHPPGEGPGVTCAQLMVQELQGVTLPSSPRVTAHLYREMAAETKTGVAEGSRAMTRGVDDA